MRRRTRERLLRDLAVYLRWRRAWSEGFLAGPKITFARRKVDTLGAFEAMESRGQPVQGVRHPRLLAAALEGKRLLNWQIKEWADGMRHGVVVFAEIRQEFAYLPAWVWQAVLRQAA